MKFQPIPWVFGMQIVTIQTQKTGDTQGTSPGENPIDPPRVSQHQLAPHKKIG
jgi:hypothetical protein